MPAARRVLRRLGDSDNFEHPRIRHGLVPRNVPKNHGMVFRDGVEIVTRGEALPRAKRVVPTAAGDPLPGFVLAEPRADPLVELSKRFRAFEINLELALAAVGDVDVPILEARHGKPALKANARMSLSELTATMRS